MGGGGGGVFGPGRRTDREWVREIACFAWLVRPRTVCVTHFACNQGREHMLQGR